MALFESHTSDIAAALDAGKDLAGIESHYALIGEDDDPVIPVALVTKAGECRIEVLADVLKAQDQRAAFPRRRVGAHHVSELESFVAIVNRYKANETVVWADTERFTVTAVFNEHDAGPEAEGAGWRDHRAVYQCPRSAEWLAWTSIDGKALSQDAFAEWVDQRLEDLTTAAGFPAPTDVLKVARDLQVHSKGTFSRSFDPTTGTGHLLCKTDNEQTSTPIPRAFQLAIPVFQGGALYRVEARIRFAMVEGRPTFTVVLHRRVEIERDAFSDVRKAVTEGCEVPLLAGAAG
jgi:uncharacterized protein YfdQ (DUF2303 family)